MPKPAKEIENYLRKGMEPKKVLEQITRKMYRESNLDEMIEEETIRLASGDGASVLEGRSTSASAGRSTARTLLGIDGTHNTTHYENMTLFTLLVRDEYGHASFSADSGLQQHFSTHHHPILWELLKSWIRITDQDEFDARWVEIKAIAPESVTDYLKKFWMKEVSLWSAAWHHLLKGDSLRGNGTDVLTTSSTLSARVAIPHFIARHHRQAMGFEGPDLAFKHRLAVTKRADLIPCSAIQLDPETGRYIVRSQSDDEIFYEVGSGRVRLHVPFFPSHPVFCKHICAVQHHFPEVKVFVPYPTRRDHPGAPCATSGATQALDRLDTHLSAPPAILPQVKVKVAPNQHSWPETRAVMNVAVKTANTNDTPASYYRPRASLPTPAPTSISVTGKSHSPLVSFDVETFDLGDNDTLNKLNHKQLRALCAKYDVDTARSNEDMVKNIQTYHRRSQRPSQPSGPPSLLFLLSTSVLPFIPSSVLPPAESIVLISFDAVPLNDFT
ncbi:hypothetical protein C8F04DRAFT_1368893 [Mycena alexandri]|uniref:Uncharacterized protein n=1 Tax=Mycena alexandri TaxID=1745969 RepID=A0AAD6WYZ9_9AGAR|nr:hypothetical protein C8F04DRAFT_1368893 [Mycena alexandri]